MSELTRERLEEMQQNGEMVALVVSPAILLEVIGKPLDPRVTIDSAYTFGDYAYDGRSDRDLLIVSLSMTRHSKAKGVANALRAA